jgi:hypothetical protein
MAPRLRSIHVDGSLPSVPGCHLMTSHDARGGRLDEWPTACESVRGPSPTSRLVHAGNDVRRGLDALGPGPFLTHLLWANRTQHHSPWTSQRFRDRGRPPEPWILARPRQPSIALEKTSPAGALPPSKLRTGQWADRPRPGQNGEPMPLLSSRQLHGQMRTGLFPPGGRRLGISHSNWSRCLSVQLIDKCLCNGTSCGGQGSKAT